MGLWTLKTPSPTDKLFDITDTTWRFSQTEMDTINKWMEKFLEDKVSTFAQKMASNSDKTFDQLLDGAGLDFDNSGSIDATTEENKEIFQYIIDKNLLWLESKVTASYTIEQIKNDLKLLEFEITSQWYQALVKKLSSPQQKAELTKSFLLGYQENIRGDSPEDIANVKIELSKILGKGLSLDSVVLDLWNSDKVIKSLTIDNNNLITSIVFDTVTARPPVTTIPTSASTATSWTPTAWSVGAIPGGIMGGQDPECQDCGQWAPGQTTGWWAWAPWQTVGTNPTEWSYGGNPVSGTPDNNEDRGYKGINTAKTSPAVNATVAYQPGQSLYVTNANENGEDTRWDIWSEQNRKAIRRFLLTRHKDLDVVDSDEKLSPDQKKDLRELKRTIIGDGLLAKGIGIENFGDVFVTMTKIIGKDGNAPIDTKWYWEKYDDAIGISTNMVNKKREAKMLALFGKHFKKRKNQEYNGMYIERFFGMINDRIMNTGQASNFSFAETYNKRNDNKKPQFDSWKKIVSHRDNLFVSSDRKWVKNLIEINRDTETSTNHLMTLIHRANNDKVNVRKVLNEVMNITTNKLDGATSLTPKELELAKDLIEHNVYISPRENDSYRMVAEALAVGMQPESIYNMKKIIQDGTLDHQRFGDEKTGGRISDASNFVYRLWDYNVDGSVGFNDRGMISGLEMQEKFRSASTNLAYARFGNAPDAFAKSESTIVYNILCYASGVAKASGDLYFHNVLEKFIAAARTGQSPNQLDASILMNPNSGLLAQYPWVVWYVQNIMKSPSIPVDAIMEYGNDAYAKRHHDTKESFQEYATQHNVTPAQVEKINSIGDKYRTTLMTQARDLKLEHYVEWQREHFMTQFSAAVLAMNPQLALSRGAAAGVGVGLDTLLAKLDKDGDHTLSAGLQVGLINGSPSLWVSLNYHGNLWNGRSLNGSAGAAAAMSTGFLPLPMAGVSLQKERELNRDKITSDLSARGIKTLHIWPEVKLIGVLPAVGFHAGLDINRMNGIEQQYRVVRANMNDISSQLVAIKRKKPGSDPLSIRQTADANILEVKKLISKKFSSTDTKIKDQMAQNLYMAMVEFGCLDLDGVSPFQRTRAADMLAEYFALQRKNQAVEKVKWWFSGVDIGLDRVIGTMVFLPSAAVSFEKYYGLRYEDTKESKEDIKTAEQRGYGNRLLNPATPGINQSEVDYLNNMLSTAARFETYRSLLAANKISIDGNTIKIPKALYLNNILNLKISSSLKWKIYQDANGDLYVPKGQNFRFADFALGQQTTYVLNIGSTSTDDTHDLHLIAGREALLKEQSWLSSAGDMAAYKAQVTALDAGVRKDITAQSLTQAFTDLRSMSDYTSFPQFVAQGTVVNGTIAVTAPQWHSYEVLTPSLINGWALKVPTTGTLTISQKKRVDGTFYYQISHAPSSASLKLSYETGQQDAPLSVQTINNDSEIVAMRAVNGFPLGLATQVDASKVVFGLANGITAAQLGTVATPLRIENNTLVLPTAGKISIVQNSNGTYAITYASSSKLEFSYTSKTGSETKCEAVDVSGFYNYIDQIKTDYFGPAAIKQLSQLEHGQAGSFHDFLANAVAVSADTNDMVDEAHVDKSIAALKTILGQYPNNASAKNLLTYINTLGASGDYDKKTYIVNKMKQVFALEDKYEGQKISDMYTRRKAAFERMATQDKLPSVFNNQWFIDTLWVANAGTFAKNNMTPRADVIGYTAFYKKLKSGDLTNQWFSLLPLGDANIYGSLIKEISDQSQKTLANEWFINKLSKNTIEKKQTLDAYATKLAAMGITGISGDEILQLLQWKQITKWTKTISFDFAMVAYAQWECCNQGIGLQMKQICITDQLTWTTIPAVIDTVTGELKTQTKPVDVASTEWGRLYVNTQYGRQMAHKDIKRLTAWVSFAVSGAPKRRLHLMGTRDDILNLAMARWMILLAPLFLVMVTILLEVRSMVMIPDHNKYISRF